MRTAITILLLVFSAFYINAQDYKKWSIEPEIGLTKIRDITPIEPLNYQLGIRKMFNTKFGFKVGIGRTETDDDFELGDIVGEFPIDYTFGSFYGTVNIGRVLKFEQFAPNYTILGGIGGQYTYSEGLSNLLILHRLSNFHLAWYIDNEFKLSKSIFFRAGLEVINGVNSRPFVIESNNSQTTSIINFNAGFTLALGKKGKEHADWYIEPTKNDTITLQPIVHNYETIKMIEKPVDTIVKESIIEYVYFKHDRYNIDKDGLANIEKAFAAISEESEVLVIGYASNVGSDEYNDELSLKRAQAVVDKLVALGVNPDQIELSGDGIMTERDKSIFDLARTVRIIIN
jgi:OmpA-OmpF porin, OOP family